jgi:hypothetical protein
VPVAAGSVSGHGKLVGVLNAAAPDGKELKYARPERERRFLFRALPEGRAIRVARIEDRYLLGTRIRLRKATERADVDGEVERILYKLTQKVPGPGGAPGLITTIYLDRAEYDLVARLPARSLRKTRLSIPPLGVDVFEDALSGLVLGEAEFADDESMTRFRPPAKAVAEVTDDPRLTGGQLVASTRSELVAVLAEYGVAGLTR